MKDKDRLQSYPLINISVKFHFLFVCLLFIATFQHANALTIDEVLSKNPIEELFPDADRYEKDIDKPAIFKVYKGEKQIGLVYLNGAIVNSTGYSGKPILVFIGLDMQGVIRSVRLVKHHEPIVLIGIPEAKITAVIDSYIGMDIIALMKNKERELPYDAVSGATVTIRVIDDSIVRSAIKIAREYGLGGIKPQVKKESSIVAEIDTSQEQISNWSELLENGAITRLKLTQAEVDDAFAKISDKKALYEDEDLKPEDEFIDLYAAQVSVPSIGRSLLGENEYKNLLKTLEPGQQAVLLVGKGIYSFKGSGYVRGGIFDRFEIVQNDNAIRFRDIHHKRLRKVAADGAPEFKEVDLFKIPAEIEFNPTQVWHVELLVNREIGSREKEFVTFNLDYHIPKTYLNIIEQKTTATEQAATEINLELLDDAPPLWVSLWKEKLWQIIVMSVALLILSWIFFFQTWLVQRPRLLNKLRLGFMLFTFFGIGLYANAQLSVVNIFTVFNALVTGFDWSYFLMDPLIFIIWGGVAGALLFWGRGAYCGWLCPFGALQELLNKVAKAFKVPQITVPWGIHERLWSLKYIIFLILFGVSLHSLDLAERLAEVEPFKTAIILKFIRDWPYVLFALAMLSAGLFIERFYCRYICPLGAALAIPARLRMFEWLKRYRQCGHPCQQCANECMVQAIHPEGQINPNECIYCQHCQQLYYDDHRCPVVLQQRLKRERRESKASANTSGVAEKILREIKQSRNENIDENT
ncbi:MAG: regulatory protein NosR [Proteobacteria bacterium]|nr:regulatory protein NosR [Pseudomonadota bacterium]NOG59673.1 regulatory protein NosR [Pseudomonadota bacterium]